MKTAKERIELSEKTERARRAYIEAFHEMAIATSRHPSQLSVDACAYETIQLDSGLKKIRIALAASNVLNSLAVAS